MNPNNKIKGRFAPSPSGELHAGNIFSSLIAWLIAKSQNGSIVLRIENLDPQRSKKHYEDKILRDYERLGLYWDEGPFYQDNPSFYQEAFSQLELLELTYPCFCTRADIRTASAPHQNETARYPGTCKLLTHKERDNLLKSNRHSWRVEVNRSNISFDDQIQGMQSMDIFHECGDFVVRRSDGVFAYQLAVVVDDAMQGINSVVRGYDLLLSTPQQMFLQDILGYSHPTYAHVPLMVDQEGRRLSKRNKDAELDELIACYGSPKHVIGLIANIAGLLEKPEPVSPVDLLSILNFEDIVIPLYGKKELVWPSTCNI